MNKLKLGALRVDALNLAINLRATGRLKEYNELLLELV
ncbi:hypothetical protein KL86CLO1_11874 [uncultured Eubacteriales bacterium]|uniref:Uncharacterized protein n=1 Tax=uncultured Eubacteriales bacterium TaxID=172733 RepID=A0A212JXQ0_9FIRM|nr:hypothetical protein KL86CLO1_11874 [uncultured Eubacteriales bacterium]